MQITATTLADALRLFVNTLFADLVTDHKPSLRHEVISHRPLTVRCGVRITGVPLEAIRENITAERTRAAHEALVQSTPEAQDAFGWMLLNPKSIAVAADNKRILFDLRFLSVQLTPDASLTPGDPDA